MIEHEKKQRGRPGRKAADDSIKSSVQVLDRSLLLLDLVAHAEGAILVDLAQESGMAPSTVHRLLSSLEQHGMVSHDVETGAWTIGVRAFEIGTAYLRFRKLGNLCRPVLKRLMDLCGETASVAIEGDGDVVFISQVESHAPVRAFFRPGQRGPIHASGIGKTMLSTWDSERVVAFFDGRALQGFTDKTLNNVPALLADLAAIRLRGWAIDDEEHSLGMRCVAAPIFDEYGQAVAGISISGPSVRLPDATIAVFGPLVKAAAEELTSAMGGRPNLPSSK